MKLRITHSAESADRHRVDLELDDAGATKGGSEFSFSLSPDEQERLRWYWEDFLEYPIDTAQVEAARAERSLAEIGAELFNGVFQSADARLIWDRVRPRLASTRIEIACPPPQANAWFPWELMSNSTDAPLAVAAQSFVRVPAATEGQADPQPGGRPPLRVLVALCRPLGEPGSSFRSPAALLLKSLAAEVRENVRIEVLRPPTFGQLNSVLLEAEAMGEPYHVMHIDGCAVFSDVEVEGTPALVAKYSREPQFAQVLRGPHGYLIFQDATLDQNCHLVDGISLAELLKDAGVSVLSLAAMPPASAELKLEPSDADPDGAPVWEALNSVAYDAVSEGIGGAFCLPYGADATTCANSLGRVYAGLAQGKRLAPVVAALRKQLHDLPDRQVTYGPIGHHDWGIPIVYEAEPLQVVGEGSDSVATLPTEVLAKDHFLSSRLAGAKLPAVSMADFLGRTETLLAIDRVFDSRSIVLLEGEAGQGKTAAAVAFADWFDRTSAEDRPVLYTSFSYHKTLVAALDQLAGVFSEALKGADYKWARLPAEERLEVALHTLNQIPVLWIWDNLEHIDGTDGISDWGPEEQEQLANFLRLARETQAKFLLTSRPTPHRWLGALPTRISLPALPMRESLQFTRILVERKGPWLDEVDSWKPVLEFTKGVPLAIRCVAERIIQSELETGSQFRSLLERLPSTSSSDTGTSNPMDAAVQHVLTETFNSNDRRVLALLHLFRDVVQTHHLAALGKGDRTTGLPELEGISEFRQLSSEDGSETTILDRLASFGLLTTEGRRAYSIHASLTPLLARLFDHSFPKRLETDKEKRFSLSSLRGQQEEQQPQSPATRAARAYVRTMSLFGLQSFERLKSGDSSVLQELQREEPNLYNACSRARRAEWWDLVGGCVHGLGALYEGSGRIAEWSTFVDDLLEECAEKPDQTAVSGREPYWRAVTEQAVHIAMRQQRLPRAEELQRLCLQYDRDEAQALLDIPGEQLDAGQRALVNRCALSMYRLGEILRAQGEPLLKTEEEAVEIKERLGETETASRWAFDLGVCYIDEIALRDLVQAERWLQQSLDLRDDEDRSGKSQCYGELGRVAWERFKDARKSSRAQVELLRHLNDARQYYLRALENDQSDDWAKRAAHNQELGHICFSLGDLDRALPYYRESIRYHERQGDVAAAAETQFTLALSLRDVDRLAEARRFAKNAQANFKKLKDGDPEMITRVKKVIETIEQRLEAKKHARVQRSSV